MSIGSASTSNSEIQQYLYQASGMSIVLDNGVSPIVYKVNENRYIASEITSEMMWLLVIISTVIVAILVVYMIVRYRLTGLVCSIAFIGYIGVLMMLIRFANVTVTLSGLFAIGISVIAYYVCNLLLLNKLYQKRKEDRLSIPSAKEVFKNEYIHLTKVLIPCFIIAIVFCFVNLLTNYEFWNDTILGIINNCSSNCYSFSNIRINVGGIKRNEQIKKYKNYSRNCNSTYYPCWNVYSRLCRI